MFPSMAKSTVLWALLSFVTTFASALSGPSAETLASVEERQACKPLANPIKTGGFEGGVLRPWVYNDQFNKGTGTVVQGGASGSKYSAQLAGSGNNCILYFNQNVTLCAGAVYELSWWQFQPAKSVAYTGSGNPHAYVYVTDPNNLQYSTVASQLYPNYYISATKRYPAGKWSRHTTSYTVQKSGVGVVHLNFIVTGEAGNKGAFRFDNVAMTLKK